MALIKRLVVVLLALGLVFGGIFGWKYYQSQQLAAQAAAPQPPATISAATVQIESWQPYFEAVGSLTASQGVGVANEVEGQVKEILFESGQKVAQGEALLQLDDEVDQAELEGLIADQRLAELDFNRATKLLKDKSVSRADYDQARAKLDRARAQVESKRALIHKKFIRAPFSGILGIRQVDIGQYLKAGTEIVTLQSLNPIFVDYSLPERYLSQLSSDQKVVLAVQAYPDQTFDGRIAAISPKIETRTRNVRIRATVENPDRLLRPGMFSRVRTLLPQRKNVLTLPRTAITYNPYGDSVFVIEKQNDQLIVQRRQVQTGEIRNDRVEITDGLKQGERVVSAGQVKLRNGVPVQIDNSVELSDRVGG
jgi:membrane fusion protein (multidrug efflux system)